MKPIIIIEEKSEGFLEDIQKGYEYLRRGLECLEKLDGVKEQMDEVREKFMPHLQQEMQERRGSMGHRDDEKRQRTPYPRGLGFYRPETGYHQPDMYERGYYSGPQEMGMRPVPEGGQRGGGMRGADAGHSGGSMNERQPMPPVMPGEPYPYPFPPHQW